MRPHEQVAEALRSRIRTGVWQDGQMIPGRRRLAQEHGVALTTVERAVASLISEGVLRADDRRGTFVTSDVNHAGGATGGAPGSPPTLIGPLVATVGIVSNVVPYDSQAVRSSQWTARIVAACEHRLSAERGISQRFFNLSTALGTEVTVQELAPMIAEARVDAIICLGMSGETDLTCFTTDDARPLVCGGFDPMDTLVPHVYIDNSAGGVLAARHLRSRGFDPIVFLRPFPASWAEARLAGARSEMGEHAVTVWPAKVKPSTRQIHAVDQRQSSQEIARKFFAQGFKPGTGVIAANDSIAMGFMDIAIERGLVAGRDYGLVGFDDWEREFHLTSLRPPLEQLGEEAARMAIMLLRGEVAPTRVALPPRLIARTSSLSSDDAE
jgi:DNA-binding LacI/PurR family transcriptional regulator